MRTALFVATFCVLSVLVLTEDCRNTSECKITSCASGAHLGCVEGKCSCLEDHASCPTSCSAKSECDSCRCPNLRAEHCVDGHCRCFLHGPGVGK